ncbi:phosphorylase [Nodosilinea sp. LEGE 06152]|uniref:phosphorylase family protein n=1 Tax=Nodosilinea sp. LEGE 06152 TaxID=2777966 RepID=UPI0018826E65|nr:phosphorylase [Nodosilinea sp. LEGE 06152]MBE9156377.1 phosphorylase [Nodosilinea sp. LEGE 06152]
MGIQVILVPVGAEYQAVMRGVKALSDAPLVMPIPAGPAAFRAFLESWKDRSRFADQEILLMGLGGSLSPQHQIGDAILLEQVWNVVGGNGFQSDRALTDSLAQRLKLPMGTGVMCDRVITTVVEKRRLGDRYQADVVDMESAVLLEVMPQAKVAILRVISDDCSRDLPNIAGAIGPDGNLHANILARSFLKRPIAALNFISGSLQALKALEKLTLTLCKSDQ